MPNLHHDETGAPTADEWAEAVSLLMRLADAHLESIALARDLMRAQEIADAHGVRADQAVELAVGAAGDSAVIDAAVEAVRAAQAATDAEAELTYSWAVHRCEIGRLVEAARAVAGPAVAVAR